MQIVKLLIANNTHLKNVGTGITKVVQNRNNLRKILQLIAT